MIKKRTFRIGLISSIAVVLFNSQNAWTCPVCYGAAHSPMIDGMNMAIFVMLGMTGCVLAAISLFFIMMRRRIRHRRPISPHQPFVNNKGILQWNNL